MSKLGEAVHARATTGRASIDVTLEQVEKILTDAGIATSATAPAPVGLRAQRIQMRGTKLLRGAMSRNGVGTGPNPRLGGRPDDGGDPDEDERTPLTPVPFDFTWNLGPGLFGIGSNRNLRGKSSIQQVLTWTLTGRCPLQPDVRRWIEHAEVDWLIGHTTYRVSINQSDGAISGTIVELGNTGNIVATRGTFADDGEFEAVMEQTMMGLLRLVPIAQWSVDHPENHTWPAYASALTVRATELDPIVGNVKVLAVRMLQMLIGSPWAPTRAQVGTVRNESKFETNQLDKRLSSAQSALKSTVDDARAKLAVAQQTLADNAGSGIDMDTVLAAAAQVSVLNRQIHDLDLKRLIATQSADIARRQLDAEKARRHAANESAVAERFFNHMTPTVCPRCAASVTSKRRAAESTEHTCSVCISDLDIDALDKRVVVAASLPPAERAAALAAGTGGIDPEVPRDVLEALTEAVHDADEAVGVIQSQIDELTAQRDQAATRAQLGEEQAKAAADRRKAELEVASATAVIEVLSVKLAAPELTDDERRVAGVLAAADKVTEAWVKDSQEGRLERMSTLIGELAREFGSDNLVSATINGGAGLTISKGGAATNYGDATPGEKLRLKIATAIAIIRTGLDENVSRHPGLLMIDSPSSEEIPLEDLDNILRALAGVAREGDMQIIVATRNAELLQKLLPAENIRVALNGNFVW